MDPVTNPEDNVKEVNLVDPAVNTQLVQGDNLVNKPAAEDVAGEAWFDAFPKELKVDTITRYDSMEAAMRGLVEKDKMISGSIRVPGPEASQEERDNFLGKLGRPASSDDYELRVPQDLVEHLEIDPELIKPMQEAGFKHGLTQDQMQGIYSEILAIDHARNASAAEAASNADNKSMDALRAKYGVDYDANMQKVNAQFRNMFPDPILAESMAKMFGQHGPFIESMLASANRSQPASIAGTVNTSTESGLSLKAQFDTITNSDAYQNGDASAHEAAIALAEKMTQSKF